MQKSDSLDMIRGIQAFTIDGNLLYWKNTSISINAISTLEVRPEEKPMRSGWYELLIVLAILVGLYALAMAVSQLWLNAFVSALITLFLVLGAKIINGSYLVRCQACEGKNYLHLRLNYGESKVFYFTDEKFLYDVMEELRKAMNQKNFGKVDVNMENSQIVYTHDFHGNVIKGDRNTVIYNSTEMDWEGLERELSEAKEKVSGDKEREAVEAIKKAAESKNRQTLLRTISDFSLTVLKSITSTVGGKILVSLIENAMNL